METGILVEDLYTSLPLLDGPLVETLRGNRGRVQASDKITSFPFLPLWMHWSKVGLQCRMIRQLGLRARGA